MKNMFNNVRTQEFFVIRSSNDPSFDQSFSMLLVFRIRNLNEF